MDSQKDCDSALQTNVTSAYGNKSVKYTLQTDLGARVGANEASIIQIGQSEAKPGIKAGFQSLNSGTPNK